MTLFSKTLKILRNVLIAVLIFLLVAAFSLFLFVKLYFLPKYNSVQNNTSTVNRELTGKDLATFAKFLTDRQFIDNVKNFDKESAKEVLSIMTEIELEVSDEPISEPTNNYAQIWNDELTAPVQNIVRGIESSNPQNVTPVEKTNPIVKSELPSVQQTAYDRIMAAAKPDEISLGMSIISKIDLSKVSALHNAGKTDELKAYIKSSLTSSEISKSLALYEKYKHLL